MLYVRFDNSNSKLNKYKRGHMLYLYAISITVATTTLKSNQAGIGKAKSDLADSTVVEY